MVLVVSIFSCSLYHILLLYLSANGGCIEGVVEKADTAEKGGFHRPATAY